MLIMFLEEGAEGLREKRNLKEFIKHIYFQFMYTRYGDIENI